MRAILPGGQKNKGQGNMQHMLKQVQDAQAEMADLQEELDEREYTAKSGGGAVEATVTGKHRITSLVIDPEVVDPDDVEILGDLIIAAVNEAIRDAEETSEAEMAKISDTLPAIPGMF